VTEESAEVRAALSPPDRVSVLVALLAHESCPSSGELYVAGGGRVARIFYAETPGYFSSELTPEDLLEHWAEVVAEADATVVGNLAEYTAHFYHRIPGWPEGVPVQVPADGRR
jgi:hypothetical protein